jgi:hypothetical protein
VRQAESLEQVNAVLEDNAATFGFLHIEVCRDGGGGPRPLVLFNGHAARAWKLDYPVTSHDFVEGDDYVLRIWCNPRDGSRPYGAERVAQILAPTIEGWMLERGPRRDSSRVASGGLAERAVLDAGGVLPEPLHAPAHLGAGVRPGA